MGFDITFPILALFSSMIVILLAFSFLSKKIAGGFIPALAVSAGILWIALYSNIDTVEGFELSNVMITNETKNTVFHMIQDTSTGSLIMRGGSNIMIGERALNDGSILVGDRMNGVTIRLDKDLNPSGTFYIGVWNGITPPTLSNTNFIVGQMTANKTTLTPSSYTFVRNDTKTYTIQTGDVIGMFFNGGDATNFMRIHENATTNTFDNSDSVRTRFDSSTQTWLDATSGVDIRMRIFLQTNEITETNSPIDFNDNPTKIYMVGVGVLFMVLGVMQRYDKD